MAFLHKQKPTRKEGKKRKEKEGRKLFAEST